PATHAGRQPAHGVRRRLRQARQSIRRPHRGLPRSRRHRHDRRGRESRGEGRPQGGSRRALAREPHRRQRPHPLREGRPGRQGERPEQALDLHRADPRRQGRAAGVCPEVVDQLLQHLVNGLVLGGTYALLGIGLTLIFGLMNLVNFAHGELYTLGAYATFAAVTLGGWNFFVAVAAAIVVGAVAGALCERVLLAPL